MNPLISVKDVSKKARTNFKERRLQLNWTQAGLSRRSDVALATLRKFERTGIISFCSLLRLASVLGYLDNLHHAFDPISPNFKSIDDVTATNKIEEKPKRRRGTES